MKKCEGQGIACRVVGWLSLSSFLLLWILCNAFWKQSSRATLKQIDLHGYSFLRRNLAFSKFTPLHLLWDHTLCTHSLLQSFFQSPLFAPCFLMGGVQHTQSQDGLMIVTPDWVFSHRVWLSALDFASQVTVDSILDSSASQVFHVLAGEEVCMLYACESWSHLCTWISESSSCWFPRTKAAKT